MPTDCSVKVANLQNVDITAFHKIASTEDNYLETHVHVMSSHAYVTDRHKVL